MHHIQLDPELRTKLQGLTQALEIRDEGGTVVGHFLPTEDYHRLLAATVAIPYSPEELARRRQEVGGCSLADLWQRLGAS